MNKVDFSDNLIDYTPTQFGTVAVLYGGNSAEREVSLMSGAEVIKALNSKGIKVIAIDTKDKEFYKKLLQHKPDRAFNVLHGPIGEDGVMQGFLEMLDIPYPGSGVLASAISMDKVKSKNIFIANGINTPEFVYVNKISDLDKIEFEPPYSVKPVFQGSSVGVSRVEAKQNLKSVVEKTQTYGPVMVEKWIDGEEYTVGVLNDTTLPAIRLSSPRGFYDYAAKYQDKSTVYDIPCGLDSATEQQLKDLAFRAFTALGCSGWGRVDLMRDALGNFSVLEVNTIPGMTPTSLVPKMAKFLGIDFAELTAQILAQTLPRKRKVA